MVATKIAIRCIAAGVKWPGGGSHQRARAAAATAMARLVLSAGWGIGIGQSANAVGFECRMSNVEFRTRAGEERSQRGRMKPPGEGIHEKQGPPHSFAP